jgi:hypothetical protein
MTPHSHPASAVLKPLTPEEAKEMAKNLRCRKVKLITKHLRQSRVISFGLVVVLTCLLSAGVIEIYLRFFLPENEQNFIPPALSKSTANGNDSGNSGAPLLPLKSSSNENPSKSSNENSSKSSSSNQNSSNSSPKLDNKNIDLTLKSSETDGIEAPVNSGGSEVDSHPQASDDSYDSFNDSFNDSLNDSFNGDFIVPPKFSSSSPSTPPLIVNSSTQAQVELDPPNNTLNLDNNENNLNIPEIDLNDKFFNEFVKVTEDGKDGKDGKNGKNQIYLLSRDHFNYSTKLFEIKKSSDLMTSFVPFTFKESATDIKACEYILSIFHLILKSPLLSDAIKIELEIRIKNLKNEHEKKMKKKEKEKENNNLNILISEFTNFWKNVCESVRLHPLYSPLLKSQYQTQTQTLTQTSDSIDIVQFFGNKVHVNSNHLSLLQPVAPQVDLNKLKHLTVNGIIVHLTSLIETLETLVCTDISNSSSYIKLIPQFEACHIKNNLKEFIDPIACINLYIHYYNDLVTQIKPSNRPIAIKAFNSSAAI